MTAPRRIDTPRPGFFAIKLVKGGVEVAARIWRPCHCNINGTGDPFDGPHEWQGGCDRFPEMVAEIDGAIDESRSAVWRVWTSGREIDAAEYRFLRDDAEWCRTYAPHEPRANPRRPIDSRRVAPVRP